MKSEGFKYTNTVIKNLNLPRISHHWASDWSAVSINIKWPLIGQDGQRQESGYKEINTLCVNTLLSLGSALDILTSFLTILTFTSTLDTCHKLVSECVGDALWEIMVTK